MPRCRPGPPLRPPLTPELHVRHDYLLTDGGEHALALEDALVVGPLNHAREELDGVANQLRAAGGGRAPSERMTVSCVRPRCEADRSYHRQRGTRRHQPRKHSKHRHNAHQKANIQQEEI